MDQNNAKIVLILLVFSIGLVQARPSLLDAIKNVKELGVGACSMERYTELTQKMQECSQQKQVELQSGLGSLTICSIIDPMLKCNFTEFFLYAIIFIIDCFDWIFNFGFHGIFLGMNPFDECYTTKELDRFKGATLQVTAGEIKLVNKEAADEFENCQQFQKN